MFKRKIKTKIILVLLSLFIASGNTSSTLAANPAQAQTPEQAATQFYRWYIGELNKNRDPRSRQKQKLLAFLSKRFGKWVYSIPDEEYGADVFIDGQDYDEEWVNAISTSKASINGNTARVTVTLGVLKNGKRTPGIGKHVLRLKLVRESGAWKIDRVNDY